MLSVHLIERLFRQNDQERLLRGLGESGSDTPLSLLLRLLQSPSATTGLALRRVAELTYGPTPISRDMIQSLLDRQDDDGLFDGDVLATACAAAAFVQLDRDHGRIDPEVAFALDRSISGIAQRQLESGLFEDHADQTDGDRQMAAAFMLLLLADCDEFRLAVRFADLASWFESHASRLDPVAGRLWELASCHVGVPTMEPAVAA